MTDSSFISQVNKTIDDLKVKFTPNKTLMMAIAVHMRESAKHNIETEGRDLRGGTLSGVEGWPAAKMFPGKQLIKRGTLLRSIQASATDNTAIASTNRVGAALMHFGGEVRAKKLLGSVKRHRDVWAMEQYFWAQYYKCGKKQKNWMILALHMQKHNSIYVSPHPFMLLTEHYENEIIEAIKNHIKN